MNPPPSDEAGGAVELAEQALLGALLWEPARVADIADWLAADDFYRPAHAAIYRTITGFLWVLFHDRPGSGGQRPPRVRSAMAISASGLW